MKRFIKVISMILCLTMLLTLLLGNKAVGEVGPRCNKKKLYEYGDFIITEDNEIYDFSDSGLQKEYIIFPEKINGKELQVYIDKRVFGMGRITEFRHNENIKKINIERLDLLETKGAYRKYAIIEEITKDYWVSEASKIKYNSKDYNINIPKIKIFCNDSEILYPFAYCNFSIIKEFYDDGKMGKLIYAACSRGLESGRFYYRGLLANIEFMYNYENAPNKGYYWIDDLETGETLAYIPKNPTREGYTFGGWYADSECSIEYDFETPYVKKELLEGVYEWQEELDEGIKTHIVYTLYYPEDYVTYIYAKWIKN